MFYLAGIYKVGQAGNLPGVRFGFTNGNLLHDEINYLNQGSWKQVCW
ncbi:hypothetical protein [Adhaeribacter arboris]|nr:hypothetical protein [Adhaeribacter arboris]